MLVQRFDHVHDQESDMISNALFMLHFLIFLSAITLIYQYIQKTQVENNHTQAKTE